MILKKAKQISRATVIRLWHRATLGLFEYLGRKPL